MRASPLLLSSAAGLAALCAPALVVLPAHAALAPWCRSSDLRASYRPTDAGAGHRYGELVLTQVAGHACRTGGYGGLSYVGNGDGTQIGAAADRVPGVHPVTTLLPGQQVVSAVSETVAANYDAATCRPTHVDGFRVYVPDATRSQYVPHPTTGCANAAVHLLSHQAYRRP